MEVFLDIYSSHSTRVEDQDGAPASLLSLHKTVLATHEFRERAHGASMKMNAVTFS
jgi:hypothetical protein